MTSTGGIGKGHPGVFRNVLTTLLLSGMLAAQPVATLTIRVISATVPAGDTLYLAGNRAELGMWRPDGMPLTPATDGAWQAELDLPAGTETAFKVTRGSWAKEPVDDAGIPWPNTVLAVHHDTTVVLNVARWRDLHASEGTGITGTVHYHRGLAGEGVRPRDVVVWLPPGYDAAGGQRYPVLYVQDGQNVFDPATSFLGADWRVDEVADSLIRAGAVRPFIAVAIYNSSDRSKEYHDTPLGVAYRRFVIERLKPMIDSRYRTLPGPDHTAVMGSSSGGLAAFLFAWKHPDVFGSAACLSPGFVAQWMGSVRMVLETDTLPDARFYIDNGEGGLEDTLQYGVELMLAALEARGVSGPERLRFYRAPGAPHNERAWARRVWRPLLFCFGR